MLPTVITTGSKTSKRRVTNACSAVIISHAAGIGSALLCGLDACPPRPRTVTLIESDAASAGPGRVAHPLVDHESRSAAAFFRGLEHEDHRSWQLRLPRREQACRPGQHGGVQV